MIYKLSNWVNVYDWTANDGYNNFTVWLDSAK
jgi:hypothetical protein